MDGNLVRTPIAGISRQPIKCDTMQVLNSGNAKSEFASVAFHLINQLENGIELLNRVFCFTLSSQLLVLDQRRFLRYAVTFTHERLVSRAALSTMSQVTRSFSIWAFP